MTQYTQPVVGQQQQPQPQQQQLQQQQQTTPPQQPQQQQQQQQNAMTQQTTNNNNMNMNNPTTPVVPNTNNNQTQAMVAVQTIANNNSSSNSGYSTQQTAAVQVGASGPMYNPQLHPANLYVQGAHHAIPGHPHHPQHQPGAMYSTMIPAPLSSNVFVNNVTANVNLHGWSHTPVPHGGWVHPAGAPHYIHGGEMPSEQGAPVMQPMAAMPVALPTGGPILTTHSGGMSGNGGGGKGSGRGRGRGGGSGSRRGDYKAQRQQHHHHQQQQHEGSPAPQGGGGQATNQQQSQEQQTMDSQQQMMSSMPYPAHPAQYAAAAAHAPQYPYGYPTAYFAPQQQMIHSAQSPAAQQAAGAPLYFSAMPVNYGHPFYNYGYIIPPVVNQAEYQYLPTEEVMAGSVVDERQTGGEASAMMWHQAPIYTDEYGNINPNDMHAVPTDEMGHNTGSTVETPTSILSPNYTPMYDQQMHEMQQQMGVMQIYDDPQMGQMQIMHSQPTGVPQIEDDLSECGSQRSAQIHMVPPGAMITTTVGGNVMPLQAQQGGGEQMLVQQQPTHLIHNYEQSQSSTNQHQTAQPTLTADNNVIDNARQSNEFAVNNNNSTNNAMQPCESVTSLNEENPQQSVENLAQDYQQQTVEPIASMGHMDNYNANNNKILMTDVQELQDNVPNPTTVAAVVATTVSNVVDVAIETNSMHSSLTNPMPQQQQQLQEKPQQQISQYVAATPQQQTQGNQNVPQQQMQPQQPQTYKQQQQQQQYHHQQLQTQPPQPQQNIVAPQQQQQQQQQQSHHQQQHSQNQQHQQQQQSQYHNYDNRKSSQNYGNNQQQQSRRKYDSYHNHGPNNNNNNNDGSSNTSAAQNQQQPQQPTTKTMSWTNSSQHKKSTNSVAVTATPSSSHSGGGGYNKQSNFSSNNSSTSTHNHGTRTYTNQQHHSYQQQQQSNYHQQQQQQPTQTRNYGAMKMPSSPVSSAPTGGNTGGGSGSSNMERKNSESNKSSHQTTSTASTTATPHQFQTTTSNSSDLNNSGGGGGKQYPQISGNRKQSVGQQQQQNNSPAINTPTASATNTELATPPINLAPPASATTQSTAPSTPSWASLFTSGASATAASNTPVAMAPTTTNSTPTNSNINTVSTVGLASASSTTSSSTATNYSQKPIAKVAPFESAASSSVAPIQPIVTPGALSYSAASAQNLPPPSPNSAASSSSAVTRKVTNMANLDEFSLKFADFLTKYKSDWATISLRPRGLTNRSNYCYINSILQALIGCSPLYNLIRSIPKQAASLCEVKTPTIIAMMSFMSNFSNLPSGLLRLRPVKGGKGNKDDLTAELQCDSAFEPTEIYKLWNDSREEHVEGRQEDAEEFLSYILNKLNDEMLEVVKLIAKPNTEPNGQNEQSEGEDGDAWQMICNNRNKGSVTRQTDFGCTPLSDIFRGELRSRLQREGEHPTDVIQPFLTLPLNIEKAASVKEALEILVGRDQLEGVTGSKTKQEVLAWQQMNVEKLPPILILHLKWFDYRSDGCTKILKKVEFPVDLKIDAKILASKKYSQKQRAYRLFAVVYHDGKEASKGHYITDVYHTGYCSWLRYDDSSVKSVSENHVLLPRTPRVPYLLYYRRCDTIPQQSNNNNNNGGSNSNHSSSSGNTASGGGSNNTAK